MRNDLPIIGLVYLVIKKFFKKIDRIIPTKGMPKLDFRQGGTILLYPSGECYRNKHF